jgi:putative tryptophan/tyrosine transport system substrate-binding protein
MRRREFIAGLGGVAAWPLVSGAQRAPIPVIGFLSAQANRPDLAAFSQGLTEVGYVEGRNVAFESRWEATTPDRAREFATDLVRQKVAVILASNDGPALAAKRATSIIPIVFVNIGSNPVKLGLVASINRPGGNVTGVGFGATELAAKRLELLCQLVPTASTVAYLTGGPSYLSFEEENDSLMAAAGPLGRQLIVVECRSGDQLERSFMTLVERGAGAVTIASMPLFGSNMSKIVALAAQYKIPAMYSGRQSVLRGGLMSYAFDFADNLRIAGGLVGKILNGIMPADLPVRTSTQFDFVINLKTAKQLGLEVPQHLLLFANKLID